MLVLGFPVGPLQANCYLFGEGDGHPCVVVDPGQEAMPPLREQLDDHGLTPAAVLLTHGHFDHIFSAYELCRAYGAPVYVHPADRYMLSDPAAALGPEARQLFQGITVPPEPDDVRELSDSAVLDLAGIRVEVSHSPGHTEGSVLLHLETPEGGRIVLAGDTLFAGSIGRTDLPGGDHEQMLRTLSARILPLDDETVVLPGHGPTTTIGRERASNPFLAGLRATTGP